MVRTDVKYGLAALAILVASPVLAQGAPVPNVNDCTFIRDPIALRDCIELYEGQRLAPGPRIAALQQAPVINQSLVAAAGPIPARYATARRRRVKSVVRPTSYRTTSSSVRIEQMRPYQ